MIYLPVLPPPLVHLFPIFLDWLQIFAFTEPLILYLGGLCLGKNNSKPAIFGRQHHWPLIKLVNIAFTHFPARGRPLSVNGGLHQPGFVCLKKALVPCLFLRLHLQ